MDETQMDPDLVELADAHGVATWFENSQRKRQDVPESTVVAVLGLLGVDASTPAAIRSALAAARDTGTRPGTIVLKQGTTRDAPGSGELTLEDGGTRTVTGEFPADLPLGWHRLRTADEDVTVVVVPRKLPEPPAEWGWMLQLYALRSADSWGLGDLGDLREFAGWAAADGAGLVLLNPLHAITPTLPVPASPYSPSSRRFVNPLYLRVSDTDAYQRADPPLRAQVDALAPPAADLIDYTRVWQAKRAALELLWPYAADIDLAADPELTDFATFCALAESHGPNWRSWPEQLRRPGPAATAAADPARVAFHAWLQHLLDEQLAAAAQAAGPMGVGLVMDLAVGIDPNGADGWLLQDVLADGVHAGAPPDAFNQLGQDWGLACWRPDRLAATGYAPYRDMLRRLLRRAGGIRVDHVAQLWRLWWVPPGVGAADGTYVRYDPDAMLGILALEAYRAGAVVIGEDLGTVLPVVTEGLQEQNMLGSAVLWFTKEDDEYLPAAKYPRNALASISTHDLPTARGFLTGAHVTVRAEAGQLAGPVDEERARAEADRVELLELLRAEGLIGPDAGDDEIVVAMHAFLRATPCRLVTASLYDVLDEVRQPNLPGTTDQYPNWRIPLPATLEQIRTDPRVARIVEVLNGR